MNNEIRFYKKLALLITIVFLITLTIVVLHYESDTSPKYVGKPRVTYSIDVIEGMIRRLPDYQGDSVLIDEDGKLTSSDRLIQSVIDQMYNVNSNINSIKQEAIASGQPEPYVVYKTAIRYYILEHGKKGHIKIDTIANHR